MYINGSEMSTVPARLDFLKKIVSEVISRENLKNQVQWRPNCRPASLAKTGPGLLRWDGALWGLVVSFTLAA